MKKWFKKNRFKMKERIMVKVIHSCEDENTQYLEFPDGLRLIIRNGKYDGWYVCK